jgi:hypothetical protein
MKLVIKVKPPKGRAPHRPTKVEPQRVRYDRKRAKRSAWEELKEER